MELAEETLGITCLLCDVNDGSFTASGFRVMNNSNLFPIYGMTALLKVQLPFEVLTDWCACDIESRTNHLLFDVILVCCCALLLFIRNDRAQLFLLAAAENQKEGDD